MQRAFLWLLVVAACTPLPSPGQYVFQTKAARLAGGAADTAPADDGSTQADGTPAQDGAAGDTGGDAAADLGACGMCGDGDCKCGETPEGCPTDCQPCGDKVCALGESPKFCPTDCCQGEKGAGCGDGLCMGYLCGEAPDTCPQDCASVCGNTKCEFGETPANCPDDCDKKACGDGKCTFNENPQLCPEDCKSPCGNCTCDAGENASNCPVDCGFCGDDVCSNCSGLKESPVTCALDCTATGG